MKKLKPLKARSVSSEEFEETLKNTIFKVLTPEEREELNNKLPKSLRRKSNEKK